MVILAYGSGSVIPLSTSVTELPSEQTVQGAPRILTGRNPNNTKKRNRCNVRGTSLGVVMVIVAMSAMLVSRRFVSDQPVWSVVWRLGE